MTRILRCLPLAALAVAGLAQAVPLTSGGYSESFDGMSTGTAMPTGWAAYSIGSSHSTWSTSIPASAMGGGTSRTIISALLDSAIASGTRNARPYNLAHAATPTDRVLGTIPTGTDGNVLELSLTNAIGSPVSALEIGYDIVKFTDGTKQSSIDTRYVVGEELPGYQLFYSVNGGSWIHVASLDPVAVADGVHPVIATGSPAAAGNAPTPDYAVTSIGSTTLTLASPLAANQTIKFRWVDDNAINISGDQAIGLNNVNITAVPEPGTSALLLAGGAIVGWVYGRRQRAR